MQTSSSLISINQISLMLLTLVITLSSCTRKDELVNPKYHLDINFNNSERLLSNVSWLDALTLWIQDEQDTYCAFKVHFDKEGILSKEIWTYNNAYERAEAATAITKSIEFVPANNMEYVIESIDKIGGGIPSNSAQNGISITIVEYDHGFREVWSSAFGNQSNSFISFSELGLYKVPKTQTIGVRGKVKFDCDLYHCCDGRSKRLSGDGFITFMLWYTYD
ncbi:MAG: hypothetical protein ACI8Q1_003836 [Parvicella sp.]|jgi:hypothetical protein